MVDRKISATLQDKRKDSEKNKWPYSSNTRTMRTMRRMPAIRTTRPSLVKRNILTVSLLLKLNAKFDQSQATTTTSNTNHRLQYLNAMDLNSMISSPRR